MAPAEIYVDPSLNADSGLGTLVSPYGDLEFAVRQALFDVSNGTRVNVKTGVNEILVSDLSIAAADTSVNVAWQGLIGSPIIFQGYNNVAGDGGIAGISGGGLVSIWNNNGAIGNYLQFKDLHLHNVGNRVIVDANDWCSAHNVEFSNTTGSSGHAWSCDTGSTITSCYIHDVLGYGIIGTSPWAVGNWIENVGAFAMGPSSGGLFYRNIVIVEGTSAGFNVTNGAIVVQNSIYSRGGTGFGIGMTAPRTAVIVAGNLIEGFSGVGGYGIKGTDPDAVASFMDGNSVFDCATPYDFPIIIGGGTDNEILTASPFADAANGDFSPVQIGNVREGSLPARWTN